MKCEFCGKEFTKVGKTNFCSRSCRAKACSKRRMETLKKRHGFYSPFEMKETRDKTKETNLKKYGVENVFSVREIQEKAQKKVKENNSGVGASSEKISKKMKKTMLKKHDVDCAFKMKEEQEKAHSQESKEKAKRTNLLKYGCECSVNNEEIQ